MADLTVALRLTADGKPLVAEVKGAQAAIQQLGPSTQQSAQQASAALRQVEVQARSTSTALATVPAQSGGLARVAASIGGVPQVLSTVATAAGSAGSAFGALGTVASVLTGGVAGLAASLVSLGVQYGVAALAADKASDAEKKLAEAMEFAERRMKSSEQAALDLAFAKRSQALATLEAAKAIQAETLAQLQQDLEFAQSGRTTAEELARRPGRVGTMRQRTAATAAENRADDIRDIGKAADEAAAALAKTEAAIAAVVAPSRDEAARGARTGGAGRGAGGREQAALDPFRNFREAALRLEEATRTPLEVYQARVRELDDLVTLGGLSQETYNRAVEQATAAFAKAGSAAGEAGTGIEGLDRAFDRLNDNLQQTGKETADYLAKAALGIDQVKFSFEQLAQKLGTGILSKLIQDEITGPLTKALVAMAKAGIGGLFGGGGVGANTVAAGTSVADLSRLGPAVPLHIGGIAGREAPMGLRAIDPALLAGAPKFHAGGYLGPGEVPAILRRGEGVFTEGQMKALGPAGGSVTVNVIDQRSGAAAPAEVSERADGNGGRVIDVLIRDAVNKGIADGSFDRAARGSWGVSRRGS